MRRWIGVPLLAGVAALATGCTAERTEPSPAPTSVTVEETAATGEDEPTGSDEPTVPERTPEPDEGVERQEAVDAAIQLMHEELGSPVEEIAVLRVEDTVWPSSAFGCPPEEGEEVTIGSFPGYRIILGHDEVEMHYHGGDDTEPRRCEFTDF